MTQPRPPRPLLRLSAPFIGLLAFLISTLIFVWLFQNILLPFVLGAIIAYLINPLVTKLHRVKKIKRPFAVILILGTFLLLFGGLLAVLLPLLIQEASQFINNLPSLINKLEDLSRPWIKLAQQRLGIGSQQDIEKAIGDNVKEVVTAGAKGGNAIINIGASLISLITVPIFTFIIAYFMLNEWPRMAHWTAGMIPRPYQATAKSLARDINIKLSGFIRGQLSVAFMLGIAYAVSLAIAGLNYGIFIGFMSGILCVIPMVGSTIGLLVSVGVAFAQEGTFEYAAIIAAIFFAGQLIEGNFLTPKIVGDSVGIHPLWVFFALLAGGSLMGVVGMLIAVPVAAIASVLLAFTIEQYKQSVYYQGHEQ